MENHWFRNAIFYSLDIETFCDSNGDGIGDFTGLTSKLDYLSQFGIDCLWLLPFFPSPNRDNGYDVMDYYGIDNRLGTMEDFHEFMEACRQRNIKVIIDLVVNHTSIDHPWFQEARKSRNSTIRNYYVWEDQPPASPHTELLLSGEENRMWTFDELSGQYYLHRFYSEQPDLNIANKEVQQEILRIMEFWLNQGVSGFRVDAAAILIEPYGIIKGEKDMFAHFLGTMRSFMESKNKDAILLAEANVPPKETEVYLNKGKRMNMLFNFYLNQHLFSSMAKQTVDELEKAIKKLPELFESTQWLNFLRHHDELALDLLTEKDRQKVFEEFGPQENMQIFGRGIRRRLAPMVMNDRRRLELFYSLLFSLPGVPLVRYGDEIGMGDDLSLKGRNSVRTAMQWDAGTNGGFSSAPSEKLVHPVVSGTPYGYEKINVDSQLKNNESFLCWMKDLVSARKKTGLPGYGDVHILQTSEDSVMMHEFKKKGDKELFVHNFSDKAVRVKISHLQDYKAWWPLNFQWPSSDTRELELGPYGYCWMKKIK